MMLVNNKDNNNNNQQSNIDLRSNATQCLNGSEEQLPNVDNATGVDLTNVQQNAPISAIIAEETQIYINGNKQIHSSQNDNNIILSGEGVGEAITNNAQIRIGGGKRESVITQENDVAINISQIGTETFFVGPPEKQRQQQSTSAMTNIDFRETLLFNIKLTDLSDVENPFVIYENKKID